MFQNSFGRYHNVECGLVHNRCINNTQTGIFGIQRFVFAPVPLTCVSVTASVVHAVAQVEITQIYSNKETQPIEAIYFFPIDSNGAVTHFHAELEGRKIIGVVRPNEEAKAVYEQAIQNRQTAFLGQEKKPDIFKMSIGYLKPGVEVKVVIGYVTEVKNNPDTHSIKFFLPTTVAPRYVPIANQFSGDQNARELSNLKFSHNSPASLAIKVIISIQGEIKSLDCPAHKVIVESIGLIPGKPGWKKLIVSLVGNITEMDSDFVLLITPELHHQPRLYSETLEDGSTALMTHFIPSFKLDDQKVELIVVIDRSGSMQGSSIQMAKKALLLFLHSMPVDSFFNIIGFGDHHHFLFGCGSTMYNQMSLSHAIKYAESIQADMNGTNILDPLKELYSQPIIPGYLRQVFVITDGQVSNTDQVISIVNRNAHKSRVFALGIGTAASHHLVEGIAQAGGGTCAFVESDENIQKQTLSQLKNALQPSLTDVKVEWKGLVSKCDEPVINKEKTLFGYNKPFNPTLEISSTFTQSPRKIPPIYDGSQMVIFGVFPSKEKPTGVKIIAESPDGPLSLDLELSERNDVGSLNILHRLAAIKIIRELELEEISCNFIPEFFMKYETTIKSKIIDIAVKNGISSRHASFIAVDKQTRNTEYYCSMQTRHVPSQIPQQQQQQQRWSNNATSGLFSSGTNTVHNSLGPVGFGAVFGSNNTSQQSRPFQFNSNVASNQGFQFENPASTSNFGASMAPQQQKTTKKQQKQQQAFSFGLTKNAGNSLGPIFGTPSAFSSTNIPQQQSFGFSFNPKTFGSASHSVALFGLQPNSSGILTEPEAQSHSGLETGKSNQSGLNLVYRLINLQRFEGSFLLDTAIANIFATDINRLKSECLNKGWDEIAWATALATVFFEDKLAEWKDYWELVVNKSQKWLDLIHKQINEQLILNAKIFISSL